MIDCKVGISTLFVTIFRNNSLKSGSFILPLQIEIFQPNSGKGCEISSGPPALPQNGQVKCYNFGDLPQKYRKRYDYAAKFVRIVRSKTPKVTLYTEQAKCMLMENSPSADFEVNFYNGMPFFVNFKYEWVY